MKTPSVVRNGLFAMMLNGICWVAASAAAQEVDLQPGRKESSATRVSYTVTIRGTIITPADNGTTELPLTSEAQFEFLQRSFPSQISPPFGLRAYRRFRNASVNTVVGADHRTRVQLPQSHRLLQVYGTDTSLVHLSTDVHLSRQQVDLLQLPCDPLAAVGLLPGRVLKDRDEKWNADAWVMPLLTGMEAVVTQSVSCRILELDDTAARIGFEGKADGAVNGSASQVQLEGEARIDRTSRLLTELTGQLVETRSPGTVSPGLKVTADIRWTQTAENGETDLPAELSEGHPEEQRLLLTLPTPWRLLLLHSREWHLFHETTDLVMLRMLRNGRLLGQCNIVPAPTMPPGEFTPVEKFVSEVGTALASRQAVFRSSNVIPDKNGWRLHHVRSTSDTSDRTILWDYYLCTHPQGEQFLFIISCTKEDTDAVQESAETMFRTLTLRPVRPQIPLPR